MRCKNVTEDSLIQIAKLQFLEKLAINQTVNVPIAMFDYLYKLKTLSCYRCPSVTDECIIKVINNCKNLHDLNIYGELELPMKLVNLYLKFYLVYKLDLYFYSLYE